MHILGKCEIIDQDHRLEKKRHCEVYVGLFLIFILGVGNDILFPLILYSLFIFTVGKYEGNISMPRL